MPFIGTGDSVVDRNRFEATLQEMREAFEATLVAETDALHETGEEARQNIAA